MAAIIRMATVDDAQAMLDIYSPIITNTATSFELQPPTVEDFQHRILSTIQHHPWLVCDIDGNVTGYAYAGPHRSRAAYQWSTETSVYIAANAKGKKVGKALYTTLLDLLKQQGFYNAYAGMTLPNDASVGFHESFGFEQIGVYEKIGFKFNQWHSVSWSQLALSEKTVAPTPPISIQKLDTALFQTAVQKGLNCISKN
jgi:L-amino acid N-acyltransferase YncA